MSRGKASPVPSLAHMDKPRALAITLEPRRNTPPLWQERCGDSPALYNTPLLVWLAKTAHVAAKLSWWGGDDAPFRSDFRAALAVTGLGRLLARCTVNAEEVSDDKG
jgi:hypothetical protein